MKSYTTLKTKSLGDLLLIANEQALLGVYFADRDHAAKREADCKLDAKHPVLRKAAKEIAEFLDGKRSSFTVPLEYKGTAFQKEIWKQIARVPFGKTINYSELADRAGASHAVRAVGTATGKNPLSIVIPCHRIMGKDKKLRGYAGGLERKQRLLELEKQKSST